MRSKLPARASMFLVALTLMALAGRLSAGDLETGFRKPPPEFSPVPIWWWSGDPVEPERLSRQLERLARGGIHNAIVLNLAPSGPLYGSAADDPPFLSERWWELFAHAVREGKRLGVRIWFYDQLGFSGAGLQARVVRDHPEYRGIELRRVARDIRGPAEIELACPPGGTPIAGFVGRLPEAPEGLFWIWDGDAGGGEESAYFRRTFSLDAVPPLAYVTITCDNGYTLYVNGAKIGAERTYGEEGWRRAERYDVTRYLRPGRNAVAVAGVNLGGPAGLLLELRAEDKAGGRSRRVLGSDASFRVSRKAQEGWERPDFDDAAWRPARILGSPPCAPWGVIEGLEAGGSQLGTPLEEVRGIEGDLRNGRLQIAVGKGFHRVALYYTVPSGFDYHNPDAARALLDLVHGEMERRLGEHLGKEIAGSFQDEFPSLPRVSRRLFAEFPKREGYDIRRYLPALYEDVRSWHGKAGAPSTVEVRCALHRVAAALAEDAFFRPLYEWHQRFGMLCGYDQTIRDADPLRGERYYVDYFKTMRHYSAPGNDQSGDAKPHQSIADLYGRPRVWLEGFHSSGWGQTLEDIAVLLRAWYVRGSNLYDPHAVYYSTHGSYWEWAPPDTGWRQPYFIHYPLLAGYASRLSYLLSQGTHAVEIAVLHPSRTVHAFTGLGEAGQGAREAAAAYRRLTGALDAARLDYVIADEDSLQRGAIRSGRMQCGEVELRAVLLPAARVLESATAEALARFAEAGGYVAFIGPRPRYAAGGRAKVFERALARLSAHAERFEKPDAVVRRLLKTVPRPLEEPYPVLRRRISGRDFYFVLVDTGTEANWNAQYAINKRRLWETPWALGAKVNLTFSTGGVPELWDALTGGIRRIWDFSREGGRTRVGVELAGGPAPLLCLREPRATDPVAVEADFEVVSVRRERLDGEDVVVIEGFERFDRTRPKSNGPYRARVVYHDAVFKGSRARGRSFQRILTGPFECEYLPTCDNAEGDFAWPPSPGPIPVETRVFRYREEGADPGREDPGSWKDPGYDDSTWETVTASFGPRAEWFGPLRLPAGTRLEDLDRPPADAGPFRPAEYSLRLGIDEDPAFRRALGGKGRIPEEFIDCGNVKPGDVYLIRTIVTVPSGDTPPGGGGGSRGKPARGGQARGSEPPQASRRSLRAVLRLGGGARKRAWLNGREVRFAEAEGGSAAAGRVRAGVELLYGANRLEILAARTSPGRLRLFHQFLSPEGLPPDPQWIWSRERPESGWTVFTQDVELPCAPVKAEMVVALGDLHRIRVNGKRVADQGDFDPYFTSRAERYDLLPYLRRGRNRIEIEARDEGTPTGLLLDGLAVCGDGTRIAFVSGTSFRTRPLAAAGRGPGETAGGVPARILGGPSRGYLGETAMLFLYPRPHPLPYAGWLLDQPPPPPPFDRLVFSIRTDPPPACWFRFRLPPGARALELAAAGEAELFVAGERVPLERKGDAWRARLPEPERPRRVAALRVRSRAGFERGAALLRPITFEVGKGKIDLGSWDQLGLPHYAGGLRYLIEVDLPELGDGRFVLDLGRVRGSADVEANGVLCGSAIWHPYRFDLTRAVRPGRNRIAVRVYNTLGPHYGAGHPSGHVFENHTLSGIFGPIEVRFLERVALELQKAP